MPREKWPGPHRAEPNLKKHAKNSGLSVWKLTQDRQLSRATMDLSEIFNAEISGMKLISGQRE